MADPVRLRDILHRICGCGGRAVIALDACGPNEHRAIQACARCAPKARAWAARAGPVHETRLAPDGEAETGDTNTLF